MDNLCLFSESISANSSDAIEDSSNIKDSEEIETNKDSDIDTSQNPQNVTNGFCDYVELQIIHQRTAEEDPINLEHDGSCVDNLEHDESCVDKLKVIDVNSADAIRQAIKELHSERETEIPIVEPATISTLESDRTSSEEVRNNQEYKPESGDQLRMPQDNTRKRKNKPSKSGPSSAKRVRQYTIEEFYVGKLSNVVEFERVTRSKSRKQQNQKALVNKDRC